jgi:hypothetical protein
MRLSAAVAVIFAFGTCCNAQDVARSWYPLQPGNSWTYRNESLSGDMAHPDFERWTTEETVISAVPDGRISSRETVKSIRPNRSDVPHPPCDVKVSACFRKQTNITVHTTKIDGSS